MVDDAGKRPSDSGRSRKEQGNTAARRDPGTATARDDAGSGGGVIFREDLARKIVLGRKTVTRRPVSSNPRSPWADPCKLRVDGVYAACPGRGEAQVCKIRVRSVQTGPLGVLSPSEARKEGLESFAEFMAVWIDLHGFYDRDLRVHRVEFEVVESRLSKSAELASSVQELPEA